MNENLDLIKILEGCPEGNEFYSAIYGVVTFIDILPIGNYPIRLNFQRKGETLSHIICTAQDGRYLYGEGECTLFPSKDQRDWSKFERFWGKPKVERFDVATLQPYDKILVRDTNREEWSCGLFSHIANQQEYPVYTVGTCNKVCIPYNEETKHLVGTTEDCPEYYKWWEE